MHSLLVCLMVIMAAPLAAQAEPLYRSVDERGVVRFSATPPSLSATPAKLPELSRLSPKESGVTGRESCRRHGGINCGAGADEDGSVICRNGFRNSLERFAFTCTTARLTIVEEIPGPPRRVIVRNTSGVTATNPRLSLAPGKGATVEEAPTAIEPYGIGEFLIAPTPLPRGASVSCDQCR